MSSKLRRQRPSRSILSSTIDSSLISNRRPAPTTSYKSIRMEKQSGMNPSVLDHIQTEQRQNYMLLNADTTHWSADHDESQLVTVVIQKPASYKLALETAIDVFKVPEDKVHNLILKCRLKGSPKGTRWMRIQPAVWNDIVDDMELFLSGFYTSFLP